MIRMLIQLAIFFLSAAIGLVAASVFVDGFELSISGFAMAVVVFGIAQSLFAPFAMKMAHRHAPRLLGGIGLVSTFLALLVATFAPEGLRISGVSAWMVGTLVVWLFTALGAWLLPLALVKKKVSGDAPSASGS